MQKNNKVCRRWFVQWSQTSPWIATFIKISAKFQRTFLPIKFEQSFVRPCEGNQRGQTSPSHSPPTLRLICTTPFLSPSWRLFLIRSLKTTPFLPSFSSWCQRSARWEQSQKIMAAMQKAVVTIDRSKTIRSVNREAVRMFGYQRAEELIGFVCITSPVTVRRANIFHPLNFSNSVTILVPPPWKEQHDSFIDNYHRTGIAKVWHKFSQPPKTVPF